MPKHDEEIPRGNREKKVDGRAKRRRYVQGTRSYLHALTNSVARRASKRDEVDEDGGK